MQVSADIYGLDDVVALFNKRLEEQSDPRRFVALQTLGDWHAYFLISDVKYKKLCKTKLPALPAIAVPGVEESQWLALRLAKRRSKQNGP